ncbi:hypothetical protein A0H81_03937 [Grifola frondosa]|uniref:Aminoglycoside phosphotransferase domain-containing protein n=1 Tax=Grifola frondosa TaxID=5627 RepID=A0A1C7MNZ2_GRIFR|nr:hypothetical protein A0H81_03937 [Grifola frondosa]
MMAGSPLDDSDIVPSALRVISASQTACTFSERPFEAVYSGGDWYVKAAGVAEIDCPFPVVFGDDSFNSINVEFVLFEKPFGTSLDKLWPTLSIYKQEKIIKKLAEVLLNMFNYRSTCIHTLLTKADPDSCGTLDRQDILMARAFDGGILELLTEPSKSREKVSDYLEDLVRRTDRVLEHLKSDSPVMHVTAGWPWKPHFSAAEIQQIRETWSQYLTSAERAIVLPILQCADTGLLHTDLKMSRIIVRFNGAEPELCITGWEHAHFVLLWSCARLPIWLQPHDLPMEPPLITPEQQLKMRQLLVIIMRDGYLGLNSRDRLWAYVFGRSECLLEDCLGSHWLERDYVEADLRNIKQYWELARPSVPFPFPLLDEFDRVFLFDKGPTYETNGDTQVPWPHVQVPDGEVGSSTRSDSKSVTDTPEQPSEQQPPKSQTWSQLTKKTEDFCLRIQKRAKKEADNL